MATESRKLKLKKVLSQRLSDLTIVIENVHDPHNVSAMFRSADAVGISEVQLLYTNQKIPKVGRKSSASAVKWIAQKKFDSAKKCFSSLKKKGYKIYATRIDENSKPLFDIDFKGKTTIVFGNEHEGVSDEILNYVDESIYIPMRGMVQSLNVSVSCGIILYEILRQRLASGLKQKKVLKKDLDFWLQK